MRRTAPAVWLLAVVLVLGSMLPSPHDAAARTQTTMITQITPLQMAHQGWSTTLLQPLTSGSRRHLPAGLQRALARTFAASAINPTLTAPGSSNMGFSVSLSADGSTALVGDYNVNNSSGDALIFSQGNGDWSARPVTLSAPDTFYMGIAVALSADGQTALVSSVSTSVVYIYNKPLTGWTTTNSPTAQLTVAGDTPDTNLFGSAVALSADGSTALVGDSFANTASVFLRPGGGWQTTSSPAATLSAPNAQEFGVSVALSADASTALIGDDELANAFIFTRPSTGWSTTSVPVVVLSDSSQVHFGFAVALSSAGTTALVADDLNNSVYVFTASGGGWGSVSTPMAMLSVANPVDFGFSVALSSDGSEALIGDIRANKAYVFRVGSGGWSNQTTAGVTLSVAGTGAFGSSVALSADGAMAFVGDALDDKAFEMAVPPPDITQTVTLPLAAGWNLMSLPLSPTTTLDAQTVLTTLLATTNGRYAEIDSYSNGQFKPSLYNDPGDGLGIAGTNFTLQLGHGYALYTDTAGSLSVTGLPVTAITPLPLAAGWNLVGFPDAVTTTYKAYGSLSSLLATTNGRYAEIDSYNNGQFSPSAFDDPGDQLGLNGSNFTIRPGQGYALYSDSGSSLSL